MIELADLTRVDALDYFAGDDSVNLGVVSSAESLVMSVTVYFTMNGDVRRITAIDIADPRALRVTFLGRARKQLLRKAATLRLQLMKCGPSVH